MGNWIVQGESDQGPLRLQRPYVVDAGDWLEVSVELVSC